MISWCIDTKVSPSLQKQQQDLERSLLQDAMEQKIQERPDASALIEKGILTGKNNS